MSTIAVIYLSDIFMKNYYGFFVFYVIKEYEKNGKMQAWMRRMLYRYFNFLTNSGNAGRQAGRDKVRKP